MVTLDKATADAVKQTKSELRAKASHRRQLSRNTARKRAAIAVTQSRQQAHVAAIQARGTETRSALAQREVYRSVHRQQAQGDISAAKGAARNAQIRSTVGSVATPSSDSNLIMVTMFVIAGLIVSYILVTNPSTTSWLGGLGNTLHAFSSNKPLFTATAKGT
uniref:Uncharacterized protein n=1 Tax=viral metagenome TaxID=1070528 RepID=A0A6M3LPS9_9ZZZZ